MNVILSRKLSKNGNDYFCLSVDLGYTKKAITFDTGVISELVGVSVGQLYDLVELNSQVVVAVLERK